MLGELGHDRAGREARRWVGRVAGVVGVVPTGRPDGALEVWVQAGTPAESIPTECAGVPVVVRVAAGITAFTAHLDEPRP